MSEPENGVKGERAEVVVVGTTCAQCGKSVGLLWFKGRSTLIEPKIDREGDELVATIHKCRPPGRPPEREPGRPTKG